MECTQRLECTQDVYETSAERTCPEQIGFLGLCGSKHPIKKGPNKIGRDPQTCSIVLNDSSISRHHAVINILNKRDFLLMDLDSSNKTKLLDKFLQPYIPQPLKNGDTVQFGQLFGIFRLLEENDDLPMTQVVEIPETPVNIRHVSRLKTAPIMTIPESPDVSDRDDSVIGQSQPQKKTNFKSTNNNLIKSSGKNMGIQQDGTNKIDNVYWNSSKKSDSFSSNFESSNKISVSPKKFSVESSIYDMETQPPTHAKIDQTSDSINEAITPAPSIRVSPTIYSCETQVQNIEKLPEVFKVRDQSNVQLNLFSTNENFNIFDAETQVPLQDKDKRVSPVLSCAAVINNKNRDEVCSVNKNLNSSDEEICFEDIDCPQLEGECGSQPLLPSDPGDIEILPPITNHDTEKIMNIEIVKTVSNVVINDSDSKDCEEITPFQVVAEKLMNDLDVTDSDCKDNMIELMGDRAKKIQSDEDATDCEDDSNNVNVNNNQNMANDSDLTDCEDDLIEISQNRSKANNSIKVFEDLPTQVISEDLTNHNKETERETDKEDVIFEDMLTQVIEECPVNNSLSAGEGKDTAKTSFEDLETQRIDTVISQKQRSSTLTDDNRFKRPHPSPRFKQKNTIPLRNFKCTTVVKGILQESVEENENYYDATQQIISDLCSQSDQLNDVSGEAKPSEDRDGNERINSLVSNMSKEQVREVIGADEFVAPRRNKKSSDSSDLELTPKKLNPSKSLMIDLPSSQDITSCGFVSSNIDATDSSYGFGDTEIQDNKQDTHVGFHRKRRKKDVKQDLLKKFDIDTLPTRVITRLRKPTSKILDSDDTTKKKTSKILESKLGLDKEFEIDAEVLQLNLKRLRTKMENPSSTKSMKGENDAQPKQNSEKDSKTTKDHKLLVSNEKVLKQQNIKSMFNEPSSKDVKTMEACRDLKTELIDSTHNSRRSSRNNSKGNKTVKTINQVKEVNSESSEKKKPSSRKHSSRKQVKEMIELTEKQEIVTRRSKRQQATKDKKKEKSESNQEKKESNRSERLHTATSKSTRSNASLNTEHSKVYNLSSEAAVDSPVNLKRPATSDLLTSNSKKSKASNAGSTSLRPASARGNRTQYVLFTAFPCEEVKLKLEKLGAVIVTDVRSCTVVLTLQIRRTFKLLCALGLGKPIVGPNWVQACADSHMIVDPWLYLMKDEVTEKRFGFNLRQSLTCKRNFLKGYNVFCTPNVSPSGQEMKSIVECSGGTWKEGGRSWFCVSCPVDKALWPELRKRGAKLVSTEFILGGVLQQRINLDRDKLG